MTKIEELEAKVKELQEKIEEMKAEEAKKKTWPDSRDRYWYISTSGGIFQDIWGYALDDKFRLSIGNVFRTEEEADFALEQLKVIHELKKFAEPEDRPWKLNHRHYKIYYCVCGRCISVAGNEVYKESTIYFESEEKANEAIKAVGEDRILKYYLGVEV